MIWNVFCILISEAHTKKRDTEPHNNMAILAKTTTRWWAGKRKKNSAETLEITKLISKQTKASPVKAILLLSKADYHKQAANEGIIYDIRKTTRKRKKRWIISFISFFPGEEVRRLMNEAVDWNGTKLFIILLNLLLLHIFLTFHYNLSSTIHPSWAENKQ